MPNESDTAVKPRPAACAQEPTPTQSWRLSWAFGSAQVQSLGGMLGPVHFRVGQGREVQFMHTAEWAEQPGSLGLPGVLRRLRGEWPCVPFGRCDTPLDLPAGWQPMPADDEWPHGYGANERWHCVDAGADALRLAIDYPTSSPIARIERHICAVPDAPALSLALVVHPRRNVTLPLGLHPTFRLPTQAGRLQLELGAHEGIYSYPSRSAGDVTRLRPDSAASALSAMPGVDGPIDLSQLPLQGDCEELLQVRGLVGESGRAPLQLHDLDQNAVIELRWDTQHLPDLMLWISNRGRRGFPWMGQHLALGAEPVNSVFDLGRVARPPAGHPLADRRGVALVAGQAWTTRYRIAARCRTTPQPA